MIMLWFNKATVEELGIWSKCGLNDLLAYLSTDCGSYKPEMHVWMYHLVFANLTAIAFFFFEYIWRYFRHCLCQSHLLQTAYYFIAENGNTYLFSFLF